MGQETNWLEVNNKYKKIKVVIFIYFRSILTYKKPNHLNEVKTTNNRN